MFLHPAALCAAAALGFAQIHVLMAWVRRRDSRKLVGFWALRERRVAPFWPSFLATPPYDYAFVSSPVIDPEHRRCRVAGVLRRDRRRHPALPKVIKLKLLDADAAAHRPMMAALRRARADAEAFRARTAVSVRRPSDRKRSGSTAKKLRQDWNRLSALGGVDIANDRTAEGARAAFEVFLGLELRSWKGQNGTALLSA